MARRFYTLDAMRGVAALIVLAMHATDWIAPIPMPRAWLAVDLFFVLSGFVLSRVYDPRLAKGMTIRQFMLSRYIRLYPLYILGTGIGCVSGLIAIALRHGDMPLLPFLGATVSGLLMLPSPTWTFIPEIMPLNPPAWSLVFELFANLVYVVLWRYLKNGLLYAVTICAALVMIALFFFGDAFAAPNWLGFWTGFPRVLFSFFVGVILGRRYDGALVTTGWAWLLPLIIVPLLFLSSAAAGLVPIQVQDAVLVLIGMPLLVAGGARFEPRGTRIMALLGIISYPLYAIHDPLFLCFWKVFGLLHMSPRHLAPYSGLALLVGVALLSYLLDRFYDQPVRTWLTDRLLGRRAQRLTDAATPL